MSYNLSDTTKIYLDAIGVTPEKIKGTAAVQKKGAETAAAVITAPFDIIMWVKDNWQVVIIGAVALLVLLKD